MKGIGRQSGYSHSEESRKKMSESNSKAHLKPIFHHTKYIEIHGIDDGFLMSQGEHLKLHRKLRKEGKCNIPPDMLKKVSATAHRRRKFQGVIG